jgi:CubicO group peptidase (beta-lactamase class C family)
VPNGALYSTVGDLARFEVFEMMNGPEVVLPREALKQNYDRVVIGTSSLDIAYGIGYEVRRVGSHVFLGHSGAVAGYLSIAYIEPATNEGIVILHNGLNGEALGNLSNMFFHRLDGQNVEPAQPH